MTKDELRRDAEQIIEWAEGPDDGLEVWEYHRRGTAVRAADVCRSYLAEHRADDDESFSRERVPSWWTADVEDRFVAAMESFERDPLSVLTTCGKVRQLCKLLGVELKEPK